jgi:diphthamide synthase (EF-2-diphthine--ammonia ligase)
MREREREAISAGARQAAISWTGGKDCNLALLTAWRDPSLHVSALVVFRPQAAVFRAHPLHIMQKQADALSLPLLHVEISGEPSYKASYVSGMRRLKEVQLVEDFPFSFYPKYQNGVGRHCWLFLKQLCYGQEQGIEVVVTGDMDLVGSMQRNWIEECGEECGIDAFLPLWQADRNDLLRKLLHEVRP